MAGTAADAAATTARMPATAAVALAVTTSLGLAGGATAAAAAAPHATEHCDRRRCQHRHGGGLFCVASCQRRRQCSCGVRANGDQAGGTRVNGHPRACAHPLRPPLRLSVPPAVSRQSAPAASTNRCWAPAAPAAAPRAARHCCRVQHHEMPPVPARWLHLRRNHPPLLISTSGNGRSLNTWLAP